MKIEDLQYSLSFENIACEPPDVRLGRRDLGKMLVVNRETGQLIDSYVMNLTDWLNPGDALILNNSKRIPGELKGRTESGAQVDIRFAGLESTRVGLCRIYPNHFIKQGAKIILGEDKQLTVISNALEPSGLYRIEAGDPRESLESILKAQGFPITSFFSNGYWKLENYNNFYATEEGSIESPMAGLHMTPDLINRLELKGVRIGFLTLHSVGSWIPFQEEEIEGHKMLSEKYSIPQETAELVNSTIAQGGRVVACGSTVMRTLEAACTESNLVRNGHGETDLYITPGYEFKIVSSYFTNFHTYRSSLMVLDAAFCSVQFLLNAYGWAAQTGYLFHEFGDAVLYV
jgi:S-adenosylmethionine:tRNA ribosyltransferase-isomerase